MVENMRKTLTFTCNEAQLSATLDQAGGKTGLLIVSGGNEIRIGAHRGMAKLAQDIAEAGHPVFRFDRRGIGDSEGDNDGFLGSAVDLAAAVMAFRQACPQLTSIVAFGNCDAAAALALHRPAGVARWVLANPWVIEASADAPAPAAVKAHYLKRLTDPAAWFRLLRGGVNLRRLLGGLSRITAAGEPSSLAADVGEGIALLPGPVSILLAKDDNTAIAFADQWDKPAMAAARARGDIGVIKVNTGSHSFAEDSGYAALKSTLLSALNAA
jgi:exosortase A-associated hydrolase 1